MNKFKKLMSKIQRKSINASKVVSKSLPDKLKNRQVIKDSSRVTINTRQPVYTQDKSRFFKKAWEVEKRQLYFND